MEISQKQTNQVVDSKHQNLNKSPNKDKKTSESQISNSSSYNNVFKSKVLFDLKKCEHLYQTDKSKKQEDDINAIMGEIYQMKEKEKKYYSSLLIDDQTMQNIFGIEPEQDCKFDKKKKDKIIADDPIEGKIVMTKEEFVARYKMQPNVN